MKPKQADTLRYTSAPFNREEYQPSSIERIAEHVGISKMTFCRYYADKKVLILAILKQKKSELIQDLAQITADKATVWKKLFIVFDYYHRWFICDTFHGRMFTRALFEYGALSPVIREQYSRFKSLLWQLFRDILLQVLKPEPAKRVAMMMVMLIDGVIVAQQAGSAECRETPPGITA